MKVSTKKLAEYPDNYKFHQFRIRSEICILLEIILISVINFPLKYSTTFVSFSQHPWSICCAGRCIHFTVPSGTRGALFFLRGQIYISGSTFIKKFEHFVSLYIVACLDNTSNKPDCKITGSLWAPLVQNQKDFNCIMVVILILTLTLCNSNFLGISINFSEQSFSN